MLMLAMRHTSMRFEVLMTVCMKITIFLDATRFTLLVFLETFGPHFQIKKGICYTEDGSRKFLRNVDTNISS